MLKKYEYQSPPVGLKYSFENSAACSYVVSRSCGQLAFPAVTGFLWRPSFTYVQNCIFYTRITPVFFLKLQPTVTQMWSSRKFSFSGRTLWIPLALSNAKRSAMFPKLLLVSWQLCVSSHQSSALLPMLYSKHLDIDPSPLSGRTEVISSPKNTSTDVNLIMCGRKSQETNGERGINSSQLAAAQHLMLTLKLCQKSVKCLSIKWIGGVQSLVSSVFSDHSDLPQWGDNEKDDCGWLAFWKEGRNQLSVHWHPVYKEVWKMLEAYVYIFLYY